MKQNKQNCMKRVSIYLDQIQASFRHVYWNNDKCRCECQELIDKGICNKGSIWNSSNCECKYDKSCDVGEYLDYKNRKCRKKLVDKLVDECTENINEVKTAEVTLTENMRKCSSCILYIVLFFTTNVGISTYFVYYKYMNRKKKMFIDMVTSIKRQIININNKY